MFTSAQYSIVHDVYIRDTKTQKQQQQQQQ